MSNNAGSALAQQTSLSIESPAERSVVLHQSPSSAAIDLPTNNTLVPTTATTALQDPANNSQGTRVGNTAGQVGRYAATNDFANDYSAGMGYNGLGMSGLGYGGLGMGGMYGGLGMGGMYGGLGMGGMYGGLGMGGMYGGLGMGGMYGMGMSEDFQRSQMTFMLVGRLLEMCGMFAGVIQMTFGSALQFMGSYIGMSQQYNKLQSGMYVDEGGRWVELPKRNDSTEASAGSSANRTISRRSRQTTRSGMLLGVLRRLLFMLIAVSLRKRGMACHALYSRGKSVLASVCGFACGWYVYRFAEEQQLIGDTYLRTIRVGFLKTQLLLQEHILPTKFTEKYGHEAETLKAMIKYWNSKNDSEERWSFEQLFRECQVPEQIAWLEEHVSEDIPYFYIADLVGGWCRVHKKYYASNGGWKAVDADEPQLLVGNDERFVSSVLCKGIVEKAKTDVLPYDIAVRALCILASSHEANAQVLSNTINPQFIVEKYRNYVENLQTHSQTNKEAVAIAEVSAATLELLNAINKVLQKQRRIKIWLNSTERQHPVAAQLNATQWCTVFNDTFLDLAKETSKEAHQFLEVTSHFFKCPHSTAGSCQ